CFLGGIRNGIQRFSPSEAGRHATMMLLAVTGLLVPAFFGTVTTDHFIIEELSVAVAIILLLLYGAYIGYSFTTAEEEKSQAERGTRRSRERRGVCAWRSPSSPARSSRPRS